MAFGWSLHTSVLGYPCVPPSTPEQCPWSSGVRRALRMNPMEGSPSKIALPFLGLQVWHWHHLCVRAQCAGFTEAQICMYLHKAHSRKLCRSWKRAPQVESIPADRKQQRDQLHKINSLVELHAEKLTQAATFILFRWYFVWWCSLETKCPLPFWLDKGLLNNGNQRVSGFPFKCCFWLLRGGLPLTASTLAGYIQRRCSQPNICFHTALTLTCP